jgi:hypothetical protein
MDEDLSKIQVEFRAQRGMLQALRRASPMSGLARRRLIAGMSGRRKARIRSEYWS